MRRLASAARIRAFLSQLGSVARSPATAYLTGGSTAVLLGWRESTIDIDLKLVPDSGDLLRALPALKEALEITRHFDLTAQAVAKLERGHTRDVADVEAMLDRGLVSPAGLLAFLDAIETELYRFPAIDPRTLREPSRQPPA